MLQNDINSKGNNQWFNFTVDFRTEGRYKFTILNFVNNLLLLRQKVILNFKKVWKYSVTVLETNRAVDVDGLEVVKRLHIKKVV